VVDGADEIKVALADERDGAGRQSRGDGPATDIAVLKVDGKKLAAITVTDSDKLEVGDVVLAVGNPFGVGRPSPWASSAPRVVRAWALSITRISSKPTLPSIRATPGARWSTRRSVSGLEHGHPQPQRRNQGIGFAVPITWRARHGAHCDRGKVSRGYLGVMIQPVTRSWPGIQTAGTDRGAVGEVTPQSPAAEAGLKEGDVIIEFNGKKVTDSRHLRLMAAQTPPGTRVPLKVIRDGKGKGVDREAQRIAL